MAKYSKLLICLILTQNILFSQSIITDVSRDKSGNILKIEYFNTSFKKVKLIKVETYFSNGQLQMVESYQGDIKNGDFFEYFKNGKIKSKGYYLDRNANGIWSDYYNSGEVERMYYSNKNGKHGSLNEWYENGQKKNLEGTKMERKMEYGFHGMKMI